MKHQRITSTSLTLALSALLPCACTSSDDGSNTRAEAEAEAEAEAADAEADADRKRIERERAEAEATLAEAQSELTKALDDLAEARETLENHEKQQQELDQAQSKLTDAEQALADAQAALDAAESEEEIAAALAALDEAEAELNAAKAQRDEAQADLDAAEKAKEEASKSIEDLQAQLEAAQQALEDAQSQEVEPVEPGPSAGVTSWLVGHWTVDTAGAYVGSLVVVDDLSENGSVDLDDAEDFGTDLTYSAPGNGTVLVGRKGQPNLQRFHVSTSGTLELTGQIGFDFYGVTDTMGRSQPVIQFVDDEHALYIDMPTLQVIAFNPSATPMYIYPNDGFSIVGLLADSSTVSPSAVHREGNRVFVIARYYADGLAVPLTKVAIIDLETKAVAYAEDTRCGNVANSAADPEGNVYFGSHPAQGAYNAAGLSGDDSPPSCIIRIKNGEDDFDPTYFANLEEISGGGVVGSLLPGIDGYAYLLEYTREITPPLTGPEARGLLTEAAWQLHLIKLEDPASTYTELGGVSLATGYAGGFTTTVGHAQVPYLILPGDELRAAYYWDVSDPTTPKRALGFLGTPGSAVPFK